MQYFLILCFFSFSYIQLYSQTSLDPNLSLRNFKFEQQVYDVNRGTTGFVFSYEYFYQSDTKSLISISNDIRLYKNGQKIYTDTSSFVALRTNAWATTKTFIPYRKLDLNGGWHQDLSFVYHAKEAIKWSTMLSFDQPNRCLIELDIQTGSIKQKLKQWDKGANPIEWLPDPYSVLTTGLGTIPVYTTNSIKNSYSIDSQKLKFYILEHEQLHWAFYDEDGMVDEDLGKLALFDAHGDFEKVFRGQMFGNIKGLTYVFSKKLQQRQPISIYANPILYKDREGVEIIVEYNLAEAYKGEKTIPSLTFRTKDSAVVDIPYLYNLENTTALGQPFTLDRQGRLSYFIPFYAWNNNIYKIECSFELEDKSTTQSAPRLLYTPIVFDKYISYTIFEIEEYKKYMGVTGLKIQLGYQVKDINRYSDLEILFLADSVKETAFHIYQLDKYGNAKIVEQQSMLIKQPKARDTLEFFVPYQTLKTRQIRVEMSMIPDMKVELIAANSPELIRPTSTNDAALSLSNALPIFNQGDYGQVFSLKSNSPQFFLNYSRLNIHVQQNGKEYTDYFIHTNNTKGDSLVLVKDTGSIDIVLPFRHLRAKDSIRFSCFVSDLKGYPMSDTIQAVWRAPSDLHNKRVSIGLEKMVYSKDAIPENQKGKNTKWQYQVFVGSKRKMNKALVKEFRGKDIRDKFRRTFKVHREDLIQIKLVHSKTEREVLLWSGDLGRFELNKNRTVILDKTPVKKAVIKAKVVD